jgi:hypothetical protein
VPSDHIDGAVDRISLADASQVDTHTFPVEGDRAGIWIESQVAPAGAGASLG